MSSTDEAVRARGEAIDAWLASLDPLPARVLRAASVFGRTSWRGGVCAVEPLLPPVVVDAQLAELARQGLMLRREGSHLAGEDAWTFADPHLAALIASRLPPAERSSAHARAAAWLQSAGELDAAVIAAHLTEGGRTREAAPWCAEAARAALREGRYDDAIEWADRALAAGVDPTTESALYTLQLGVHDARGDLEEAERCGRAAWEAAPRASMEWFRAAASLSVLAMRRLRPERFRELAPALEEALRNPDTGLAAAGLALAVTPMLMGGQYALADLVIERLEEILRSGEHPEPTFPARVYSARAARAGFDGDLVRYMEESRRAAGVYDAVDEPRFSLLHWGNVGFAQTALGDLDGAAETLAWVFEQASARDLRRIAALAQHNLGLARLFAGRVEEAYALEVEALTAAESLRDLQLAGQVRLYLARALLAQGDAPGACEVVAQALDAFAGQPGARVLGMAVRAEAMRALGDVDAALRSAEEGLRVLAALGSVEEGEGLLRLAHVEALLAAGESARALDALRAARERLRERARRVETEFARIRFLYSVPEHARTLELAEALLGEG